MLLVVAAPTSRFVLAAGQRRTQDRNQAATQASSISNDAFALTSAAILTLSRADYARARLTVGSSQGLLQVMKLTREQHDTMVADVERLFPRVSDETGGDHPVTVSVRVLHAFVKSGWRAADERTPVDH